MCSDRLSANRLIAYMLSPTWWEVAGQSSLLTPSPMVLSRGDNDTDQYPPGQSGSSALNRQAFWHPGIGMWQLDERDDDLGRGMSTGKFNSRESAIQVAIKMSKLYCQVPTAYSVFGPWCACGSDGTCIAPDRNHCETTFNALYSPSALPVIDRDTLTTRNGGSQVHECRLAGQGTSFPCVYVNPGNAEGTTSTWIYNPPGKSPPSLPSALTLPFYVYREDGAPGVSYEWRYWLAADTGYMIDYAARRAYGSDSRNGLHWVPDAVTSLGLCDISAMRGNCGAASQSPSASNLSQLSYDGSPLPIGTVTPAGTVILRGIVKGSRGNRAKIELEVRLTSEPFRGEPNSTGNNFVSSGSSVSKCVSNLPSGRYHWQARAKDEAGQASPWISFGSNAETAADFEVQVSLCAACSASGATNVTKLLSGQLSCGTPLAANLTASPGTGTAPLSGVDLAASVSGSETGTINYTFYCNRSDGGVDITPGWSVKFDSISENPKTAFGACYYANPGTYTAKVIVERGVGVAEARATINVTQPSSQAPQVTTSGSSNVTQGSASLSLSVNPNGSNTSIWFDWGPSTSFCCTTNQQTVLASAGTSLLSMTLGGLQCDTSYFFRAHAQNAGGSATGNTLSFHTSSCGSVPQTLQLVADPGFEGGNSAWWVASPAFYIDHAPSFPNPRNGSYYAFLSTPSGTGGNNLQGGVISPQVTIPSNANGVELRFWYSVSTQETTTTSVFDTLKAYLVLPGNQLTLLATVSNLDSSGTAYRERVVGVPSSFFGTPLQIFFAGATDNTLPTVFRVDDVTLSALVPPTGPPSVSTQGADQITSSSVRLSMTVNPNGTSTQVWFNLEAGNSSPSTETEHISIGSGQQSESVSISSFGLQCDTLYFFRANASNPSGSQSGSVTSFRTGSCPAQLPSVTTSSADNILATSAQLVGFANPNSFSATAWFKWGTDTGLGNTTPAQGIGSGTSSVSFTAAIPNLQCETIYYYRAVAQNAAGQVSGSLFNLTTAPCGPPSNIPPTITITAPGPGGDTANEFYVVRWTDSDPDDNATVRLSYSLSSTCASPTPLTGDTDEDDTVNAAVWNTAVMPVGTYYILGTIWDNTNPPVTSCSSGPVIVDHSSNVIFKDGFEPGDLSNWLATPSSGGTIVSVLAQGAPGQPGKDIWTTSVYSFAPGGLNPGGGLDNEELVAGGWGDEYVSLLEFNLAGLPSHASSVRLELFCYRNRGDTTTPLYLDRITQPWDWRTQGTGRDRDRLWWADRPSYIPWRADPLPMPVVGQWYLIDVTDLYNAWQGGSIPNYGMQLRPTSTGNSWSEFYSADSSDPAFRPRLVIQP